ncbi:sulfotransferase domain-containing protein [Martelella mangrovi]|uniref:Sulfotransferase domain-containing protein n=1 Tax=Martelella mangrovi TaxID=1397477 RepID=A0ABV2I7R3_9HYPH
MTYSIAGLGGTGRDFKVRPDDRFIVGYPKSGNTWLDFIVASMMAEKVEDVNFVTINDLVADIHSESPLRMARLQSPRLLKSHDYYHSEYRKVLFIVRHPYAVAVSFYYYHLKNRVFDETYSLSEFVRNWVEGKWGKSFLTWGEHTESWLDHQNSTSFLMIRYEDLKQSLDLSMEDISKFFDLAVSQERMKETIHWCGAENMARLEGEGLEKGFKGYKHARKDIQFVRSSSSAVRQSLSDSDKKIISDAWGDVMARLGYEP